MNTFAIIILTTVGVSLISLAGILTLILREKTLEKSLIILVAFSAGALMGGAFLHLIPETIEIGDGLTFEYVLIGFIVFFLIEKVLRWRHCHESGCEVHSFALMNLFGDSVHNFLDGLAIAAGFTAGVETGISVTMAIIFHEIPQEIGDFAVLIFGGFRKITALAVNFISAITAVVGGVVGFLMSGHPLFLPFLLPFTAGGFIYVSASDLLPEIIREEDQKKSFINFLAFLSGVMMMLALKHVVSG